jgi:hypothetical protein
MPPSVRDVGRPTDAVMEPEDIFPRVLALNPHLVLEDYYSERSVFYNPDRRAPLGTILASVKDHDGPNDGKSRLSRPGVYRFAFQLSHEVFTERFGSVPARPPKGEFVRLEQDPAALHELTPHPIYAWMRWVQVLCPTRAQFEMLIPLVEGSLDSVRAKWAGRLASG